MVRKVVIIADDVEFGEILYALEIADEEFEVVRLYGLGNLESYNGFPIERIDNIEELVHIEFDFILNINVMQNDISDILRLWVPERKIWTYKMFIENYLGEEKRMQCLKKRMELVYPELVGENICCGDFSYGPIRLHALRREEKLIVGKFCCFADDVDILLSVEHRPDYNTIYPFGNLMNEIPISDCLWSKGDIIIGNDVWVGSGAKILSGVTIGDGCVIGAGAVVAKSVPAYSVVVGNPGRVVKMRFDTSTIEKLMIMKWWDWSYKDIYRAIPLLISSDIEGLFAYYKEHVEKSGL